MCLAADRASQAPMIDKPVREVNPETLAYALATVL
jgi:hypothetical protein